MTLISMQDSTFRENHWKPENDMIIHQYYLVTVKKSGVVILKHDEDDNVIGEIHIESFKELFDKLNTGE